MNVHAAFAHALTSPAAPAPGGVRGHDAARRFAVHRITFVATLVDALAASFPVTQALVGEAFFRAMARACVLASPPRTPVLTEYAFEFPAAIATFAPAAQVPYLADVARIEALRIRAYHAADAQPVADAEFLALCANPEQLANARVALHPACTWFRARHAAHAIWAAHQEDVAPSLAHIDIAQPEEILVTRPHFDVHVAALPAGATALLDALRLGLPLGAAFAQARALARHADEAALFAVLLRHGLVVAFHPES
ncbi:DUF2063 domain-containing protein [Lysobacter helvus]|uniref:DUF2063 domain-containing protein n=2 Tax=Lysobacteraceae TaxID=32033 RepID=A0ABM7Q8Q2_9GAMM|nr:MULTISPECIES: DNA-binding domain-containing protein [Lysobacter]BCT93812.1 DUF2063 domain-containing protein [Lysobacter caseinilyticus]BCT96968.1 DUF2063 domain-containing protein [Lysobacter helvus]